ncbi:MAG: DUF4402 domain-containing protein [Sphingomicrobium sp.]|nr:DUF4402 domain-containing protein [Sphingomonadales bacterium]
MMVRIPSVSMALLLAVMDLYSPMPAVAQCRLCVTPSTGPEAETAPPVKLDVETNLDFDRLVLGGSGSGSAVLAPDGSRSTSGAIMTLGGRAMVGTVIVHGEPGRAVRVSLPGAITLYGPTGSEVRIDSIRSDLPSLPRIGSNGSLSFRFGGELHVSGGADGNFRGDFQVDVDYL